MVLADEGQIIEETFHSIALEDNLLEDSPDRSVVVYLPPSYDSSPEEHYPVVYLLHGFSGHSTDWIPGGWSNIVSGVDRFMTENPNREMILVMPDHNNRYGHSNYTNSSVSGNWEDFLVEELVQYIDTAYRTLPQATHRGLAGHSAGGAALSEWPSGIRRHLVQCIP